jgi:hypothetical protein
MYVQTINLENLRCFKAGTVSLRTPTESASDPALVPNVTLILGDNGSGKTTLLRAVGLAVLGPLLPSSGFVPQNLIRRERPRRATKSAAKAPAEAPRAYAGAEVTLHWQDLGERKPSNTEKAVQVGAQITRRGDVETVSAAADHFAELDGLYQDDSPAFLLVGYGASRRVESARNYESPSARGLFRYDRVAGLFSDSVPLRPLGTWLPELMKGNPGRFKQVVTLLDKLLPEECRFTGEQNAGEYVFELNGIPLPFAALSDGYRAYIAWLADLLRHVVHNCPDGVKLTENRGVILVDEIDLHLHPSWQRVILPTLSKVLPKMQFIVTSHSPIVAGTLEAWNIVRVTMGDDGVSKMERPLIDVHGLNSEQILMSGYFDLPSTRAEDAEQDINALARRVKAGDKSASVTLLRRLAGTLAPEEVRAVRTGGAPADRRPAKKGRRA